VGGVANQRALSALVEGRDEQISSGCSQRLPGVGAHKHFFDVIQWQARYGFADMSFIPRWLELLGKLRNAPAGEENAHGLPEGTGGHRCIETRHCKRVLVGD
jgi:hypothetical protein